MYFGWLGLVAWSDLQSWLDRLELKCDKQGTYRPVGHPTRRSLRAVHHIQGIKRTSNRAKMGSTKYQALKRGNIALILAKEYIPRASCSSSIPCHTPIYLEISQPPLISPSCPTAQTLTSHHVHHTLDPNPVAPAPPNPHQTARSSRIDRPAPISTTPSPLPRKQNRLRRSNRGAHLDWHNKMPRSIQTASKQKHPTDRASLT